MDFKGLIAPLLDRYMLVAMQKYGLSADYYQSIAPGSMYSSVDESREYPDYPQKQVTILLDELIEGFSINNTVSYISQIDTSLTVRCLEPLEVFDKLVITTVDNGQVPLVIVEPLAQLLSGALVHAYHAKVLI